MRIPHPHSHLKEVCFGKVWSCTFIAPCSHSRFAYLTYNYNYYNYYYVLLPLELLLPTYNYSYYSYYNYYYVLLPLELLLPDL